MAPGNQSVYNNMNVSCELPSPSFVLWNWNQDKGIHEKKWLTLQVPVQPMAASGQLIPKDNRWTVGQLAVKGRGLVGVGLWPWVHRGGKWVQKEVKMWT